MMSDVTTCEMAFLCCLNNSNLFHTLKFTVVGAVAEWFLVG
jgi:hypothetical protein